MGVLLGTIIQVNEVRYDVWTSNLEGRDTDVNTCQNITTSTHIFIFENQMKKETSPNLGSPYLIADPNAVFSPTCNIVTSLL